METFQEWKEISTLYDRRRLLFDLLFNTLKKSMNIWQIANYLVANRRPNIALELLEQNEKPDPTLPYYAEHCAAFGKANLNMTNYTRHSIGPQKP